MIFNTLSLMAIFAAGSAIASPIEAPAVVRAAAAGATHVVVVGSLKNAKAVTFTPNNVMAAAGDTVQYQFASANHTVTQAAGANAPCKPVSNAVNSGFVPVTSGAAKVQTFNMVVKDDNTPMYMYCAAANHCQLGMVMTINAAAPDASAYQVASTKAKKNVAAKNVVKGGSMGQIATKQVGKQPN